MSDTSAMAYSKGQKQRSSVKEGVLRNFAEFTGKHLCQSLFFNEVPGLRPATLLKKKLWHIFCELCEILTPPVAASKRKVFTELVKKPIINFTKPFFLRSPFSK